MGFYGNLIGNNTPKRRQSNNMENLKKLINICLYGEAQKY